MFLVDFTLCMFLNLLKFCVFACFLIHVSLHQYTLHRDFKYLPEPASAEPNGKFPHHLSFCCSWVYYPITGNNITSLCIWQSDTFYFLLQFSPLTLLLPKITSPLRCSGMLMHIVHGCELSWLQLGQQVAHQMSVFPFFPVSFGRVMAVVCLFVIIVN